MRLMWTKRIAIVLIAIVCVVLLASTTYYKRDGVIVKIDNEYIYIEDTCGYTWRYKGEGTIGDKVVMTINSKSTSTIRDDKIIAVRDR